MAETTRFAPSPTGLLHLGNAYAALFAARAAGPGGRFLLRFEDIDRARCRAAFEQGILEELRWLGLSWEEPVWRQSEHLAAHGAALERLQTAGLLYPCFCTRAEIAAEIARMASAPQGPQGPLYPGTCRRLDPGLSAERLARGDDHAWRLDVGAASRRAGPLDWEEVGRGRQRAEATALGDVVLGRKEIATSYHLAVTLDDAAQEITLVTRGEDLFAATHMHRLLQALLGLPVPRWQHHRLLTNAAGKRLAKRDRDFALAHYRAEGVAPAAVRALAGFADLPDGLESGAPVDS